MSDLKSTGNANLDQALEVIESIARDIFTKHRYPFWVKATRRVELVDHETALLRVKMTNHDRWLEYTLRVQAGMNLTPNTTEFSIWTVAELGPTFDLFLPRDKFAVLKVEYTCTSKDLAYHFNQEFKQTLLYWQALVQMNWTDINLFQLLRYKVAKLLRIIGM